MKNNRIHYSPEALNDLDEAWDYIFFDLCNPDAADRAVDQILCAVERLKDNDGIGISLSSHVDIDSEYRFLVVGSYLVFYRASNEDIYIDRVLYSKRDYLRILFPDF